MAFIELKCTTCHAVVGGGGFPDPTAADPGPALGSIQARKPEGELATAVVAPSHSLAFLKSLEDAW